MRSIGVFATSDKPGAQDLLRQLVTLADAHSISLKIQSGPAQSIDRADLGCTSDDVIANCDVLVTLSGDGGVLGAARAAATHSTPILSVDLGRLGFLSSVRPAELEQAFNMLLNDEFEIEERMMLDARVLRLGTSAETKVLSAESRLQSDAQASVTTSSGSLNSGLSTQDSALRTIIGGSIGLNDAVVAKSALARILRLSIYAGGDLVAETRADGLIISTPTGSTAYALSAGGPIVHPDVPSLLICPICAHSLTQRPLIVDAQETIEVQAEWEGDEVSSTELEAMLTIDGQIGISLLSGDIVQVRRAEYCTRLMHHPRGSFYDRLREKMRWGR